MEKVVYNARTHRLEWGDPEQRKFLTVTRPFWLRQEEMDRVLEGLAPRQQQEGDVIDGSEPINDWFELTYAQFLTIPRIFLKAMPLEWQRRMVECLSELDATFDWQPKEARFWVTLRGDDGRYVPLDPSLCDYRRGSVEHLRLEKREAADGR